MASEEKNESIIKNTLNNEYNEEKKEDFPFNNINKDGISNLKKTQDNQDIARFFQDDKLNDLNLLSSRNLDMKNKIRIEYPREKSSTERGKRKNSKLYKPIKTTEENEKITSLENRNRIKPKIKNNDQQVENNLNDNIHSPDELNDTNNIEYEDEINNQIANIKNYNNLSKYMENANTKSNNNNHHLLKSDNLQSKITNIYLNKNICLSRLGKTSNNFYSRKEYNIDNDHEFSPNNKKNNNQSNNNNYNLFYSTNYKTFNNNTSNANHNYIDNLQSYYRNDSNIEPSSFSKTFSVSKNRIRTANNAKFENINKNLPLKLNDKNKTSYGSFLFNRKKISLLSSANLKSKEEEKKNKKDIKFKYTQERNFINSHDKDEMTLNKLVKSKQKDSDFDTIYSTIRDITPSFYTLFNRCRENKLYIDLVHNNRIYFKKPQEKIILGNNAPYTKKRKEFNTLVFTLTSDDKFNRRKYTFENILKRPNKEKENYLFYIQENGIKNRICYINNNIHDDARKIKHLLRLSYNPKNV